MKTLCRKLLLVVTAVMIAGGLAWNLCSQKSVVYSTLPVSAPFYPQGENGQKSSSCFLCNMGLMGPLDGKSLAILSINSGSIDYIPLSQCEENSIKKKYGYTGYRNVGIIETGCAVSITVLPDDGLLEGVIALGEHPEPDPQAVARLFCASCGESLLTASNGYDLLLVDFRSHTVYALCCGNTHFTISNYSIWTTVREPGTIQLKIRCNKVDEK